jgi:hypothetical protein
MGDDKIDTLIDEFIFDNNLDPRFRRPLERLVEKSIRYSHTSKKYLATRSFIDWEDIIFWMIVLIAWIIVCLL